MNIRITPIALALFGAAACSDVVYDGDNLPPCTGEHCADRNPATGSYVAGREEAEEAASVADEVACERLYSDCKSLCTNPWVFCGSSESQCVTDYVRSVVEDMTFPVSS